MTYKIIITKKALKGMSQIPKTDLERIRCKMKELAENPRPRWIKKLKGHQAFRVAVGDYRIIFEISDADNLISIITVDHRKCVYRDF